MVSITIYMEPMGKGRPRVWRTKKGQSVTFTPTKTAHAENLIRDKVLELKTFSPNDIPLVLKATFFRTRPKSLKKSVVLPVSRPDWDNYGKLLCDALEGFLYANDSQITTALIKKRFGSPPRIELEIMEEETEGESQQLKGGE